MSWPVFWLVALGALTIRLYLTSLWFRFGVTKLELGWLTTNPVRGLLTLVSSGQTPMPLPSLSVVADILLALHADVVLSVILPFAEIALGVAFFAGVYVRVAAVTGIGVNAALILGGLATMSFDGKVIALQLLVLGAGRAAGALGLPALLRLGRPWRGARAPGGLLVPPGPLGQLEAVRASADDVSKGSPSGTSPVRRRRGRAVAGRSAA